MPKTNTFGIPMDVAFQPAISERRLLQYKYLLSLEGNDVATGLKWMMLSDSVVFMPVRSEVEGYIINPLGGHLFDTVSLAE